MRALGRLADLRLGPTLQVAPAWLAANVDMQTLPAGAISEAVGALDRSGRIEQIYQTYIDQ
jgi:hypothetical protein